MASDGRGSRLKAVQSWVLSVSLDVLLLGYLAFIGTILVTLLTGIPGTEPAIPYILGTTDIAPPIPIWWILPFAVVGACLWRGAGISAGMHLIGRQVGSGRGEAADALELATTAPRKWYRTSLGIVTFVVCGMTLWAAIILTDANIVTFFTGASKTGKFWRELVSPDTSLFGLGLRLLVETFFMAMIATMAAVLVAAPVSFLAARNLTHGPVSRAIYTAIRVLISAMRSVDAIIWAIIFALWVGMGTFAGALALFIHSVADLIKLYSEQLESIDQGPLEAVSSTGANALQVIRYGVIPQILNPYLSFTLYRWDINVRMATIIGVVGGGGIGWRLFSYLKSWQFRQASTLMILIMVLVWLIDYVSSRLRARLT